MAERATIRRELHFFNRVLHCFADRPANLHQKLGQVFKGAPEREVLIDGHRRLTLGALDARIEAAAALLWRKGMRAGDRVVIVVPNRAEFVIGLLAALRIGAVPVPVNVREAEPEISFILGDCAASGLIYDPGCAAAVEAAGLLDGSIWSIAIDALFAAPAPASAPAPAQGTVAGMAAGYEPPPARPADTTVCILYTSGTTGRPKGALLSDLGILHSMLHYELHLGLGPDDTGLLVVPATHITGLIGLVMATLGAGGKLVMMEQFKTPDFVAVAAAERISYTIMVPAMYNLLLLREPLSGHRLDAWRIGAYGGSVMPVESIAALVRHLPQLNLVNAYGATETTSPTSLMPLGNDPALFNTVGRPVACAEVAIMDDEGRECPRGTVGELWIRGPMVVAGYWNRPVENATDFIDGFWRSGDIGEMTESGFLRLHDRKKDLVNRGGYKVFSAEVESVLLQHGDVLEAAVIGRPDPVLGERVHAFIVSACDGLSPKVLQEFCAHELADYKIPESFTLMATALPRNANGKVLKKHLKELLG